MCEHSIIACVHATAGKIDASNKKKLEMGQSKSIKRTWKTRSTTMSSVMGLNPHRAKQRQRYANQLRKSRPKKKKEYMNPKENNRYDALTPHIHLHLQKPINEASRERPKQNAKSARSRLRRGPRS